MKRIKNNMGLSLVELIMTIGLIGIVLAVIFTFFNFNLRTFSHGVSKYDLQNTLSRVSMMMEDELRYADKDSICPDKLTEKESSSDIVYKLNGVTYYIKLQKNGLIDSIKSKELPNKDEVPVKVEAFDIDNEKNLLTYTLIGKSLKTNEEYYTITSSVELLNYKGK